MTSPDNTVKSIVYGNCYINSYGRFRALCAALTQKQHINKAMNYLRSVENLQNFNRYIYAYRLDQSKAVFMTQDTKTKGFIEGYDQDSEVEGSGQRLLQLMQRFNVKNILLIIAIGQKDPLYQFNSQHQMTVIKCAKQLLISLYQKVLPVSQLSDRQSKLPITQKLFVLPQIYVPSKFKDNKARQNNRPNYIGQSFLPIKTKNKPELKRMYQTKYLNNKIKDLAYDLQNLLECIGQEQNAAIRFTIQYDQSEEVSQVIRLLLILFSLNSRTDLLKVNISIMLRDVSIKTLSNKTINSINIMLLSNPQLRSQKITTFNKLLGIIIQFIEALMKSYGFAKKIALIETATQQIDKNNNKLKSKSMIARRNWQQQSSIDSANVSKKLI